MAKITSALHRVSHSSGVPKLSDRWRNVISSPDTARSRNIRSLSGNRLTISVSSQPWCCIRSPRELPMMQTWSPCLNSRDCAEVDTATTSDETKTASQAKNGFIAIPVDFEEEFCGSRRKYSGGKFIVTGNPGRGRCLSREGDSANI